MKKIISLSLSIIMCISALCVMPSYAADEALSEEMKDTIEILRMFDIIPEYFDYNVNINEKTTRADFVNSAAKLINLGEYKGEEIYYYDVPKTHWAYNGICALTEKGIVNGVGNKLFKPDDSITYDEAYKILLSVLGYKEYAEEKGGYPAGYNRVANVTGLSKDVEGTGDITLGDSFTLFYNAMITEVFDATVFGDEPVYEVSEETVLSMYHNVYYEEGVVTGAKGITLEGDVIDKQNVMVDDVVYQTEVSVAEYIGMEIEFFYRLEKSADTKTIIWARESGLSDIVEITVDGDASFDKEGFVLKYYDEAAGKSKNLVLDREMSVIYNGGVVTSGVDELLNKDRYELKLIKNNKGGYAAAIIKAYENVVVSGISAIDYVVYDRLVPGNSLNLDENKYEYMEIKSAAGTDTAFSSINVNNVLSVYKSLDGLYMEVVVNDRNVSGDVEKVKEDDFGTYVTINGEEYYIRSRKLDFSVGDSLTAYLDASGEIAYYNVEALKAFAGYIINAVMVSNGLDNKMRIKLLHESDKVEVYDCAEKVEVDGNRYSDHNDAHSVLAAKQVALFETDKDGKITSIDTIVHNAGAEPSNSLQINVEYTGSVHSKRNGVLGAVGVADANTIIFSVPDKAAEDTADDKDYSVMDKGEIPEDGRINIETYKTKEDVGFEQYVLLRGYLPSSSGSAPILITNRGTRLNSAGEVVEYIECYQGKSAITLNASEDTTFDGIEAGMVVRVAKNRDGEVISTTILYDYKNPGDYSPASDLNAMNRAVMGYVNNVVDGVIKIGYKDPAKVDQVMYTTNVPVLIYDTKADKNQVRIGTMSDAVTYKNDGTNCSKVFMVTTYLTPNLFILFN